MRGCPDAKLQHPLPAVRFLYSCLFPLLHFWVRAGGWQAAPWILCVPHAGMLHCPGRCSPSWRLMYMYRRSTMERSC